MKVTNITNNTVRPVLVSVMIKMRNKDERIDLNPGEFVYSNGDFNALFNKSLRVQKQKGLIDVVDENNLEQMAREEREEREEKELQLLREIMKKQEEEKAAAEKLLESAENYHPDLVVVNTKKEKDYSSNVIPDEVEVELDVLVVVEDVLPVEEEKEEKPKKKIIGKPFTKKK